jgi:HK97 gp10 family phage protein
MPVRRAGKLSSLQPKLENGVKRGLILSGKLVAQRAQAKAPRLTGRLKRSLHEGQPYSNGKARWAIDVGTNVEYARAQEFGSGTKAEAGTPGGGKPITIRARKAQALAFEWPDAPPEVQAKQASTFPLVFFRSVQHPGVAPHPYLRPALKESRKDIVDILVKSTVGAIKGT